MNVETLRQKLLAAARSNPPSDHVPYAFEKRILARITQSPKLDLSALWARALWRAAAPCAGIAFLLGVWSFVGAQMNSNSPALTDNEDLAQHFELTMFATIEEPAEENW